MLARPRFAVPQVNMLLIHPYLGFICPTAKFLGYSKLNGGPRCSVYVALCQPFSVGDIVEVGLGFRGGVW